MGRCLVIGPLWRKCVGTEPGWRSAFWVSGGGGVLWSCVVLVLCVRESSCYFIDSTIKQVNCVGVRPCTCLAALGSARLSSSRRTTSRWPLLQAVMRAVAPSCQHRRGLSRRTASVGVAPGLRRTWPLACLRGKFQVFSHVSPAYRISARAALRMGIKGRGLERARACVGRRLGRCGGIVSAGHPDGAACAK